MSEMKCDNCGAEINNDDCKYCGKTYNKPVVKNVAFHDDEKRLFLKVSGSMNSVCIVYDKNNSDDRDVIKISGSMNKEKIYTNRIVDIKVSGSMNSVIVSRKVKHCVIKKSGSMNNIKSYF